MILTPIRTNLAPGVVVPITFACSCGKTLRVKDDLAGRWVRCPACKETAIVPEAAMAPKPAFEVVEEEPAPPPPRKRVQAEAAPFRFGDDGPAPRPRSRPDQEYDGERKASRRKRSRPKDEKPDHFALERGVFNGGVAGGMLAMIIAAVWFVVGLMNDILFYYPPILFLIGLIGFFRGLAGSNR